MEELVSVIIPCYNSEKDVGNAIRSVYEQDYGNIELVVVNDGSTDGSEREILKWKNIFETQGKIFKYVYQDNLGLGGAVNAGLKYISGDYLTLLDSDDIYLQGSIRKKVEFLRTRPDYSMVRSNGWVCNGQNKWMFIQDSAETDEDYFMLIAHHKTNNWAGSYMVRTEVLFDFYKDRNIYPSRFGQNFQIILPVAYKNKCGYIDEPLMEYIRHTNSLTKTIDSNKQFENEENNRKGYKDIYYYVVNQVVKDETEREAYLDRYEIEFMRDKMVHAIQYNNAVETSRCVEWLKSKKEYKIDDKIMFYSSRNPVWANVLRFVRKVRNHYVKPSK